MPEKTTNAANGMSNLVGFEAVLQMQRPAFTALAEMHGRLYESIATVTGNGLRSSTGNSRKTWRYPSNLRSAALCRMCTGSTRNSTRTPTPAISRDSKR